MQSIQSLGTMQRMSWQGDPEAFDKKRILKDTFRLMGFWPTLKRTAEYLLSEKAHKDRSYDRWHGTDTGGWVTPQALGISDEQTQAMAIQYVPSPARITRRLIAELALPAPGDWAFVDYGCGKGRVVLVAAEQAFAEVVGIDISSDLIRVAHQNLSNYRRGRTRKSAIKFIVGDARTLQLPNRPTVFHFYNPFEPPLFAEVLAQIGTWHRQTGLAAKVVYLGAFEGSLTAMDQAGFLKQRVFVRCLEPKYSYAIYETGAAV